MIAPGMIKGDLLLCQVAERLVQATRHGDTVARLGGDEFVILMTELSNTEEVAAVQSETLAVKLLTKVRQLYDIEAISYQCSASIGITIFNRSADVVGDLLKQADMAMYKAKATGRKRKLFRSYTPQFQTSNLNCIIKSRLTTTAMPLAQRCCCAGVTP